MLRELFLERLKLTQNPSQASLAKAIGASTGQVSVFFNKNASLTNEQYEKAFVYLGVKLETYHYRYLLCREVALLLKGKGYSANAIRNLSKKEMAEVCGKPEINYFIETTKDEYLDIIKSGIIEPECLFNIFVSMVLVIFETNAEDLSTKQMKLKWEKLAKDIDLNQEQYLKDLDNILSEVIQRFENHQMEETNTLKKYLTEIARNSAVLIKATMAEPAAIEKNAKDTGNTELLPAITSLKTPTTGFQTSLLGLASILHKK